MKETAQTTTPEVVTDSWGNVDIAYYEAQAMRMRNEYFQAALVKFAKRIKEGLTGLFSGAPSTHGA